MSAVKDLNAERGKRNTKRKETAAVKKQTENLAAVASGSVYYFISYSDLEQTSLRQSREFISGSRIILVF